MLRSCLSLSASNVPEVIDLFSGCGGLALGFQKAGFKISYGIELMPEAVETAAYNLHWRFGEENGHECGDITKMSPDIFKDKIGKNGCIVIGGPPCQAYSMIGRAKLRSLGEHRINTNDKRGYLYEDFIRFALGLEARAVIMENVPEAVNYGGRNIPQTICEILEDNDYNAYWTILNSADYGVPQVRERVFVIAVKNGEKLSINLPEPTHVSADNRKGAVQQRINTFTDAKNFRLPNEPGADLAAWVTAGEALSDLPELFPNHYSKYVLNKINFPVAYRCEIENSYQQEMRTWYGQEMKMVTGNCFRKTRRDFPIFAEMQQGDDYTDASAIADILFNQALKARGISLSNDKDAYDKLKKEIVPPYDRENFKTKWQRLSENKPSHTLVAHLSVDTYSHIHPTEPRGISVREAARLQSFPDGFLFQCSMGDAFKQIGNAVPPLLAKGIAVQVMKAFNKED